MSRQTMSAGRRRMLEVRAQQIRIDGQLARWPRDRIVNEMLSRLPEVLPLHAHRIAYAWTRQQLSRAIDSMYERRGLMAPHVSPSEICGWEHGRHLPNCERQDILCQVYGTRPDRLGFGRDHGGDIDVEESDMERRTLIKMLGGLTMVGLSGPMLDAERAISAAARPQQVGATLLEGLRSVNEQLIAGRNLVPPAVLSGPVQGHLAYLRALLDGPAPPAVRRELGRLAAEAAMVAGITEFSTARREQARARYTYAQAVAAELGHPALQAHALMAESMLHSQVLLGTSPRDGEMAMAMLDQAATARSHMPAPLRASLAAQRAEELALMGEGRACRLALDEARREVARITDRERVGLLSDWTESRLAGYDGICLLLLGELRAAEPALETAMRHESGVPQPIRLMARVDLGAVRVDQGEPGEGARLIGAAFDEAGQAGRALVQRRAHRALQRLQRWQTEPAVRELRERMAA